MSNSLDSFLTRIGDVTIERVAPKNNARSPSGDRVIMNSSGSSSNQGAQGGNDEDSEETGGETSDGELERRNLVNSMMRRVEDMNSEGSGDDMDLDETIDTEIGVRMDSERMQHSISPCGDDDDDDDDDDDVEAVNILDTLPLEGAPIEGQEVTEADLLGKPLSKDDDSEDISNSQTTSDQEDGSDPSKRRSDLDENDQAKKKQKKDDNSEDNESKAEKKLANMRRNIREVMDETQLDEATLSAQRQEMERLRRVQEQQRIIREVQRQIANHRQANKGQQRVVSLLQGRQNDVGTSICQSPSSSQAKSPNSMMMHAQMPQNQQNLTQPGLRRPMSANRWQKGRGSCQNQQPMTNRSMHRGPTQNALQQRIRMMTPSVSISPVVPKKEPLEIPYYSDSDLSDAEAEEIDKEIHSKLSPPKSPKPQKGKDVVTISSSSEDSDDDCIVLSDPSGGEETDTEDDPANSGMHTNDRYNIPDEHSRVLINVGHPEGEPDVYLAPQVARIIKPHQIGGIRFLFDNIVESIERFKTSSGFGCILAHSMGLGKTLQVASFCDIFFRCTTAKTVLCIMPINTLQNWLAEFNMWLPYEDPNKPEVKKLEEQKIEIKEESSNQTDISSLSSRSMGSDARSHQEMPLAPSIMTPSHYPGYENAIGGYYPPGSEPMNQNYHHMYSNMNYPPMKQEMEDNAMKPPLPYGVPAQGQIYNAPGQMYPSMDNRTMYPQNTHQNPPQNYPNYQNPSQYPNYPPQEQKISEPVKQDIKTEPEEPKTKEEGTSTTKDESSEEKKGAQKIETPFSVDSPIGMDLRPRHFHLHILNDSHKTMAARARVIKEWQKVGGVLLIGYELYRQLSLKKPNKAKRKRGQPVKDTVDVEEDDKNKGLLDEMHGALVNPGPDLVICDEGHRIKNSHASISLALKQMRTKRRIVLTGYPLQNNLLEYWCMVDFVRPNYLGTKAEFCNMFERPIQNGQCIDSTPQDIRLMRYRAHVLHALLEGFVQRRSHSVLQVSLPRKEEYILLVRMTAHQRKLYDVFMNQVVKTRAVPNPLKAFAVCCKIWNHPDILYHFLRKRQANEEDDLDLEETIEKTTPGGKRPKAKGRGEKKGKKINTIKNKPAASVQPNSLVNSNENEAENTGDKKNCPNFPVPQGNFQNSQQNFSQNYQEFRPNDQNAYYRNETTGEYSNYYGNNQANQRFPNQQFPYPQGQNTNFPAGQQNYPPNHQQNQQQNQNRGFVPGEQNQSNQQKFPNAEFRGADQGNNANYDAQGLYNRQTYNFQEPRSNYPAPNQPPNSNQHMNQPNLNPPNLNQANLNQPNLSQQNLNQPNLNQQNYQNPLPNQPNVPINEYSNYQHQNQPQNQSHNYPSSNTTQIYRNDNPMNQHNYPSSAESTSRNNSQPGFINNPPPGNQPQSLLSNTYPTQGQQSSTYQQNPPQNQIYQQNQPQPNFMNNRHIRYQNAQTTFPPPQGHGFNNERQSYPAAQPCPPANQQQPYVQGQRFPAPQNYNQNANQNEGNTQGSGYQNSQGQMQNSQSQLQNSQSQIQNSQSQIQNYPATDGNNWQGNYQNQPQMNQVNQIPQGSSSIPQSQIPQGPSSMSQGQNPIPQGQPPQNSNQMNQSQWDQNQQNRFTTGNYFPQNYPQNAYDYQGNPSEITIKQEDNKNVPQSVMRPPNVPNFESKKDVGMGTQTLPPPNFQSPESNPPRPLQNINFNNRNSGEVCKEEDKDKDEILIEKDKEDKSDEEMILKDEEKDLKCSPNAKEDPGIPYDWATELMKGYVPGLIDASAKMTLFFCILEEAIRLGDRVLAFSQSLFTLNLIEDFLARNDFKNSDETTEKWSKNVNYYRLDGSTTALEREKLINEFNVNKRVHLFLVSTRAGSLGINLVGANRAIVFDASWNPCHDTQAVCRVYRYGQQKPCYVYRLVTDNCLERKIYDRQISKQGMADRVVDQCNPDAHLSLKEATTLSWDSEEDSQVQDFSSAKDEYTDEVMHTVLEKHSSLLTKQPFHHESLLVDRKDKKLSQAEKRLARRGYELEKMAANCSRPSYNYIPGNTATRAGGLQIRAIRGADQGVAQKPVASVRPMQQRGAENLGNRGVVGSRWIPAEVWQRQGMSAQEMTLPLDVVIPTNSPDKSSIVLKAGQRVMVLKSPKGIYMQLESGKIIAIRTALKINQQKRDEEPKKTATATPPRSQPQKPEVSFPLRNNSAISIIPKTANTATTTNMAATTPPIPRPLSRPGSASGYRQFPDKDLKRPKPMIPTPPKMPPVSLHRMSKGKHEIDHSSANENSNSSDSQPRTDQRIEEVRLEDIVAEAGTNTEYSPNNQNRLPNNQESVVEEKTHDFGTDPMSSGKIGVQDVQHAEHEPNEAVSKEEKKDRPGNFGHRYSGARLKDENDEIIIDEATVRPQIPIPHQQPVIPPPIQHPQVQPPQPIPPEMPKMAPIEQNQTTPTKERIPDDSSDPQPVPQAYPYTQYPRYYDYPDPRSRTTTTPYGYFSGGKTAEPKPEFSQTGVQTPQVNQMDGTPPASVKTDVPPPTTTANVPTAFSHPTPARGYAGSYSPYDAYSQHYAAAAGTTSAYPPAGTPAYGAYGTPSYNTDYARMYSAFGPPPPDPYMHRGYAPPPTNHPSNYYAPFTHPPPPPYPNYSFIPGYPNPNIPNESQPPAQ